MTAHQGANDSEEAYVDALRKYRGLLSEFSTLKDRWSFSSQILENADILPDVFQAGGIDFAIRFYSGFLEASNAAPIPFREQPYVTFDTGWALENISRIISLIKSGFFQRTDSMDLPYVIAGVPLSPERSWGNELYLVAADKLVLNCLQYLNIPHFSWDRFVSWSESKREGSSLIGGQYLPFRGTFHLLLSMDIKYNFQGLLVMAHELAHAACQALYDTIGIKNEAGLVSYPVLSNALQYTFGVRDAISEKLKKCRGSDKCPLKEWKTLLKTSDQDTFIQSVGRKRFTADLYECLMDSIAVKLAGTSYMPWLSNYAFQFPLRHEYPGGDFLIWNESFFMGVFLRMSMLLSYLEKECKDNKVYREYGLQAAKCFESLQSKSTKGLSSMADSGRITRDFFDSLRKCMKCVSDVAFILGPRFSIYRDDIFKSGDIPVFSKTPLFRTDRDAVRGLISGKTFVNLEPRIVLDSACKAVRKTADKTCPAGLYSLAFSQYKD